MLGRYKAPLRFSSEPHRGPRVQIAGTHAHMFDARLKCRHIRDSLMGGELSGQDGVQLQPDRLIVNRNDGVHAIHQVVPLRQAQARFVDSHFRRFDTGVLGLIHSGNRSGQGAAHAAASSYSNWLRIITSDTSLIDAAPFDKKAFAHWPEEASRFARGLHLFMWLAYDWTGLERVSVVQDSGDLVNLFQDPTNSQRMADLVKNQEMERYFYSFRMGGQVFSFGYVGGRIVPVIHTEQSDLPEIAFNAFSPDDELVIRGHRQKSQYGSMVTVASLADYPAAPFLSEGGRVFAVTIKKKPNHPFSDRALLLYGATLDRLGYTSKDLEAA